MRTWSGWFVKAALTGLLIWFAVRKVPLADIRTAFAKVDPFWAIGVILLYVALVIPIESLRFASAGRMVNAPRPSLLQWVRILTESRAFMYVLPASAGADGIVWLRLRSHAWRHSTCVLLLVFTRFLGVAVWALAASFALRVSATFINLLAQAPAFLRHPAFWFATGVVMLLLVTVAPFILLPLGLKDAAPFSLANLLIGLLLAIASALVNTGGVMAASHAAQVPFSLEMALGLMAFFNFAMILPISLGGFGIQEALFLVIGGSLGYPTSSLLVGSALVHAQRLALAMTGGAVFLLDRERSEVE